MINTCVIVTALHRYHAFHPAHGACVLAVQRCIMPQMIFRRACALGDRNWPKTTSKEKEITKRNGKRKEQDISSLIGLALLFLCRKSVVWPFKGPRYFLRPHVWTSDLYTLSLRSPVYMVRYIRCFWQSLRRIIHTHCTSAGTSLHSIALPTYWSGFSRINTSFHLVAMTCKYAARRPSWLRPSLLKLDEAAWWHVI